MCLPTVAAAGACHLPSFQPHRVWMATAKVAEAKRKLNLLKIKPHLQQRKRVSGFSKRANAKPPVCALNDNFSLRGILNYSFCSFKKMTKKRGKYRTRASKSQLLCQSAESEERGTLKHHSSLLVLPSRRHFLSRTMRQLTAHTQELSR